MMHQAKKDLPPKVPKPPKSMITAQMAIQIKKIATSPSRKVSIRKFPGELAKVMEAGAKIPSSRTIYDFLKANGLNNNNNNKKKDCSEIQ
jgi:hypothetical protein